MARTKVMEPLRWAFPSPPVRREVLEHHPGEPVEGRPPLLFVHGAWHGAWCFAEHWMPAAAERGWSSFAVSLRGHGGSEGHDTLHRWKLRDYEHDVMQTVAGLPAPPVLVGHSMGALVVERVLARYPAPAAVLVAPPGLRHGLGTVAALARRRPADLLAGVVGRPLIPTADELFAELAPSEASGHVARLGPESRLAQWETTVVPRPARPSRAPVLVLAGRRDAIVPPVEAVRTARHYGAQAHVFRGMGHDLMLERSWPAPLDLLLDWAEKIVGA